MAAELPPRCDLFDVVDDPYPTYERLRAAAPLWRGGPGQWIVPRHAEVAELLRDQRLGQFHYPGAEPASVFTQRIMVGRDRPDHTRLRRPVVQALSPRLVHQLRDHVAQMTDELLAPALERGTFDAVGELAVPLPLRVLTELLGIPDADGEQVGKRALELNKMFGVVVPEPDRVAADEAVTWLREYFGELLAERPRAPILSLIADHLDGEEMIDNAIFVLFAGFETSMNMIAGGCAALCRHPAELARLRANPALVETAVDEFLRFDTPTQLTGRIVREPVEIAGRTIKPGRVVLLLLGSANHDERAFHDPKSLDLGRYPNPHVSFGGGSHYCLGAALSRLEGQVVFSRLLRLAALESAGEVVRGRSATLRAYDSVPVRIKA